MFNKDTCKIVKVMKRKKGASPCGDPICESKEKKEGNFSLLRPHLRRSEKLFKSISFLRCNSLYPHGACMCMCVCVAKTESTDIKERNPDDCCYVNACFLRQLWRSLVVDASDCPRQSAKHLTGMMKRTLSTDRFF